MKDNTSLAFNNIQKANAAPQRRGSYGTSDFTAGLDAQPGFNPSMSSREMRKIMYYENMFSKMDSKDKSRKNHAGSQSSTLSQLDNSTKYENDDIGAVPRAHTKPTKNGTMTKKPSISKAATEKNEQSYNPTNTLQMDDYATNKASVGKQGAISLKLQNDTTNGITRETERNAKHTATDSRELNNVIAANSKIILYGESQSESGDAITSKRSSTNSLPNVTDIAGSKISKLLGIDQTASNASELSASQRQWLVPMFQIVPPKPVKKEPAEEQREQTEAAIKDTNMATQQQEGADLSEERGPNDTTLVNSTAVEPKEESQQIDKCNVSQDDAMDVNTGSKPLDIILNEEDMEIDPIIKDDEVDEEPVIKEEEDEEYVPEIKLPVDDRVGVKKPQKRRSRQKKAVQHTIQSESTTNSDFAPSPETLTPDNLVVEESYPEPPPVTVPTKTRKSARTAGKQRKKDPNFVHDSDLEISVPMKTPRGSVRSTARGTAASARKHAQEHALAKSQNTPLTSGRVDAQEYAQKRTHAVSRIISVSEAEKIVELYRQHSTDLERLKKLILMGDLSEFGREVMEQRQKKIPQHTCILDPRIIAAQPGHKQVKHNQEPPPENPIELSLKYKLVSRLLDKSNRV